MKTSQNKKDLAEMITKRKDLAGFSLINFSKAFYESRTAAGVYQATK